MKLSFYTLAAFVASALIFGSCNRLSDRAKDMVGVYYQTAISENEPVMELNDDGTCTIHAIKPGVMSYTVNGKWNVEDDSLLIETDGKVASVTGDTSMVRIGAIPREKSYAIADFNGLSLTLRQGDVDYLYQRRGHNAELESGNAAKDDKPESAESEESI